jgi:hypothetical protein
MGIQSIVNGLPTRPDVKLLLEAFKGLERDGRIIQHHEVSQVIGVHHSTNRYRSVVTAWRRTLEREEGIYLDGMKAAGQGFVVLAAPEMVRFGCGKLRQATKVVKRGVTAAGLAPDEELDLPDRTRRDHVLLHLCTALQSLRGESKALAKPPKIRPLIPRKLK